MMNRCLPCFTEVDEWRQSFPLRAPEFPLRAFQAVLMFFSFFLSMSCLVFFHIDPIFMGFCIVQPLLYLRMFGLQQVSESWRRRAKRAQRGVCPGAQSEREDAAAQAKSWRGHRRRARVPAGKRGGCRGETPARKTQRTRPPELARAGAGEVGVGHLPNPISASQIPLYATLRFFGPGLAKASLVDDLVYYAQELQYEAYRAASEENDGDPGNNKKSEGGSVNSVSVRSTTVVDNNKGGSVSSNPGSNSNSSRNTEVIGGAAPANPDPSEGGLLRGWGASSTLAQIPASERYSRISFREPTIVEDQEQETAENPGELLRDFAPSILRNSSSNIAFR